MTKTKIIFHNKADIKVQAQIFAENQLVSTCVAAPGESCTIPAKLGPYDIYFKNGVTGWRVAYQVDSEAKTFTLSESNGNYVLA